MARYLDQKARYLGQASLGPGPTCNLKYVCKDHMEHDKQKDQSGDIPYALPSMQIKSDQKLSFLKNNLKNRPNRVSLQKTYIIMKRDYFEGVDVAVTICAKDGTILDMNGKSRKTFLKDGESIIGQNVLDCHPEPARSMLADMLANPRNNVYTVEKEGVKKLIFQTPWYDGDEYAGFMELSMVLPEVIPNRVRKPASH